MSTTNVDTVATDADLQVWTGGKRKLQDLLPDEAEWFQTPASDYDYDGNPKVATIPRQRALDDVLVSLAKRRPPIRESDLLDVTQLRNAVVYGALAIVYGAAVQHEDSPNVERAKTFRKMFADEVAGLQPDVQAGATASSLTIRISRG
jgi:hypothetical protein